MTVVYFVCVYVCVCACVCALGRPLECDSRPAQWQETPWRLWQAASCTPSFAFLSLTQFSSLCFSSISTNISPSPLLHLYSLHSDPTCLFVFLSHSSALRLLGGSQRHLNNWTFHILLPTSFSVPVNGCIFLILLYSLPYSFLPGSDVSSPQSDPFGLCNLAQRALITKSHLLSFTLLFSPLHPTTQWPLEPQREGIISVRREQSSALLGCTDLTCTHSYGHPYLYITQGIIQVHCLLSSVMCRTFWAALPASCHPLRTMQVLFILKIQLSNSYWCPFKSSSIICIYCQGVYALHCTNKCMYSQTVWPVKAKHQETEPMIETSS